MKLDTEDFLANGEWIINQVNFGEPKNTQNGRNAREKMIVILSSWSENKLLTATCSTSFCIQLNILYFG